MRGSKSLSASGSKNLAKATGTNGYCHAQPGSGRRAPDECVAKGVALEMKRHFQVGDGKLNTVDFLEKWIDHRGIVYPDSFRHTEASFERQFSR